MKSKAQLKDEPKNYDMFGLHRWFEERMVELSDPLCATEGHDPELWFPEQKYAYQHIRHAVAVCARCPEQEPCLRYAMEHPYLTGIWGGLTGTQRATLAAARRKGR